MSVAICFSYIWSSVTVQCAYLENLSCLQAHSLMLTVTAQIISIGLWTWVSPIYRVPYAVISSRFFHNQVYTSFTYYTKRKLAIS